MSTGFHFFLARRATSRKRSHICPGVASARRFELHIETKPCQLSMKEPQQLYCQHPPALLAIAAFLARFISHTIPLWHLHASQAQNARRVPLQQCSMRVPLIPSVLPSFSLVMGYLVCYYHVYRHLPSSNYDAVHSNLQQELALPGHDSSPQPPTPSGSHRLCSGSHFPHCPCVASASRRDATYEGTSQQDNTLKLHAVPAGHSLPRSGGPAGKQSRVNTSVRWQSHWQSLDVQSCREGTAPAECSAV